MAEQTPDRHPGDPGPRPADKGFEGMPRWVKISGLVVLLVAVLAVVLLVLGGPGGHGPGLHSLATGSSAPDQGHLASP